VRGECVVDGFFFMREFWFWCPTAQRLINDVNVAGPPVEPLFARHHCNVERLAHKYLNLYTMLWNCLRA
jgi:hypothetical protein